MEDLEKINLIKQNIVKPGKENAVSDRSILLGILDALGEIGYKLTGKHLVINLISNNGGKHCTQLYSLETRWVTPPGAESQLSDPLELPDMSDAKPTLQSATEKE